MGLALRALLFISISFVSAQTWCGKNYMSTSPIVPPGGQFTVPEASSSPLIALRCGPAIKPYLPEDRGGVPGDPTAIAILVDTPITFNKIAGASETSLPHTSALTVTVSVAGTVLTSGRVPVNATKHALTFSLETLEPRMEAYTITCTGSAADFETSSTAELTYLPSPPSEIGGVTKMDMRTGALLSRLSSDVPFESVFPIGFYTNFNYLAQNLSVLGELKEQGFTVVHPIPTFDNLTALSEVLDEMERVGLYLMYDMRWTYMNTTAVTEEVNRIKPRPNLLLWYTADEPDGTSDPLNATALTYSLIRSLDPYHPVSLVLNCENYFFTEYSEGADILMQDTYEVGNNLSFSSEWGTVCTEDYGDCGCDNCVDQDGFGDISVRMDEFAERIWDNGWELEKAVWTVPQAFGNGQYWTRIPTGKEFVVQSIVGINHGGLGVVSWDDPTSDDIKASASALALALAKIKDFILDPERTFTQRKLGDVDVGQWTLSKETLVMVTNMGYQTATMSLAELGLKGKATQVLDSGATLKGNTVLFDEVGSAILLVSVNDSVLDRIVNAVARIFGSVSGEQNRILLEL